MITQTLLSIAVIDATSPAQALLNTIVSIAGEATIIGGFLITGWKILRKLRDIEQLPGELQKISRMMQQHMDKEEAWRDNHVRDYHNPNLPYGGSRRAR